MEKNNLKTKIKMKFSIFLLIIILITVNFEMVSAMMNPAAVYCESLGYEYTEEGCKLSNNQVVDPWKFLQGEVAQEHSYCKKNGYEIKTIIDRKKCLKFGLEKCAVCILEDGSEVEVTELMKLNLGTSTCGDGFCRSPENFKKCPEDCNSGEYDMYCDGVEDEKCDPDCSFEEDPDCKKLQKPDYTKYLIIAIILITILLTAFVIYQKNLNNSKPKK